MIVSICSLHVHPEIAKLWLNRAYWSSLFLFPTITLISFILLAYGLVKHQEKLPYWCMVVIFLCCYAGFVLDVYPFIVPYQISLFDAASPPSTLKFILAGAAVMIPVLLIYTGYSYRVFKGKTHEVIEY